MRLQAAGLCFLFVHCANARACDLPAPADPTKATFVKPIEGEVTAGFGAKLDPIQRTHVPHNGIDFAAEIGQPVAAALGGRVKTVGYTGEYGTFILLDHGAGLTSSYTHLRRFTRPLGVGTCVRSGDVIGTAGNTAQAPSRHLHFEIHLHGQPIDPAPLLGVSAPLEAKEPPVGPQRN